MEAVEGVKLIGRLSMDWRDAGAFARCIKSGYRNMPWSRWRVQTAHPLLTWSWKKLSVVASEVRNHDNNGVVGE